MNHYYRSRLDTTVEVNISALTQFGDTKDNRSVKTYYLSPTGSFYCRTTERKKTGRNRLTQIHLYSLP